MLVSGYWNGHKLAGSSSLVTASYLAKSQPTRCLDYSKWLPAQQRSPSLSLRAQEADCQPSTLETLRSASRRAWSQISPKFRCLYKSHPILAERRTIFPLQVLSENTHIENTGGISCVEPEVPRRKQCNFPQMAKLMDISPVCGGDAAGQHARAQKKGYPRQRVLLSLGTEPYRGRWTFSSPWLRRRVSLAEMIRVLS